MIASSPVTVSADERMQELVDRGVVEKASPIDLTPQRSAFGLLILLALQGKPMYLGTVSAAEKAQRRARGKRAKAARKVARRR